MKLQDRTYIAYECDHMRPVVFLDRWQHEDATQQTHSWHHVDHLGRVLGPCQAGVYEIMARYSGNHALISLRREI